MSVVKSAPSTSTLLERYLSRTPTPRETDALLTDLKVMNRGLLSDAIEEAEATTRNQRAFQYADKRLLIHRIYTRKMKELASLHPVIFSVENALRSAHAVQMTTSFDRRDWWTVIRDAIRKGKEPSDIHAIFGKKPTQPFLKQAFRVIASVMEYPGNAVILNDENAADDVLYPLLSLGQLQILIQADWTTSRAMFAPQADIPWLNQTAFQTRLKVLKDARNSIYHSNPVKDRSKIMKAADDLLCALGVHLATWDDDLKDATYVRYQSKRGRTQRHKVPARPFPAISPT